MGKTFKDIKKFDVKRHKENARDVFKDIDTSTRVKPAKHKEKGGGKNWKQWVDAVDGEKDGD